MCHDLFTRNVPLRTIPTDIHSFYRFRRNTTLINKEPITVASKEVTRYKRVKIQDLFLLEIEQGVK